MEEHIQEVEDGSGRSMLVMMNGANDWGKSLSGSGEAEILRQSRVWKTLEQSS